MRKTIAVERIKEIINEQLKNDKLSQDAKEGLCGVLEIVLMETGNYHGFNHLGWLNGGSQDWIDGVNRGIYSETDYVTKQAFIGPEFDRIYY
jgi:hypothetical protein